MGVPPANEPVPSARTDGFKGINNRLDPTRLGFEYPLEAVNVLCDDAGYLTRRPGLQPLASGYVDLYGTRNGRLLLVTTDARLVERFEDGTETTLATGLTGAPFQWAEVGTALFVQGQGSQWAIYPDRVIPWGSLCPPVPDVYPLTDAVSYPPPLGHRLGTRRDQAVVVVWEPERDRSALFFSRSGFPHEFVLDRDYLLFPGQVRMVVSVAQGLVIGTDRAVYTDPIDSPVQRVADYGVPLEAVAADDRNTVFFWSERGLCKALPFENLTDQAVAVEGRSRTAAGILPFQGSTYCIVSQTGPLTPKRPTRPFTPLSIAVTATQGVPSA